MVACILSGCGYKVASACEQKLVSVPLIQEDDDGVLRNSLARALSETGKYRYSSLNAPYELIVKIDKTFVDTIGYEWDVDAATGQIVNRLYPNEGRKTVLALVTLQDSVTKEPVVKPFRVTASANYDFVNPVALKDIEFTDSQGKVQTVLQYSLGQLDSEEGARGEVSIPLFEDLASKIKEVLIRAPQA